MQSLIPHWAKVAWGGGFGFTLGYFGAQAQLNGFGFGWSWNFAWHVLDNVTWAFVWFFQAHLLEVSVVKIVKVRPMVSKKSQLLIYDFYFKRDLKGEIFFWKKCSFILFFSKEILCQPPLKNPLLTKEFFYFSLLNFWKKYSSMIFFKKQIVPRIKNPLKHNKCFSLLLNFQNKCSYMIIFQKRLCASPTQPTKPPFNIRFFLLMYSNFKRSDGRIVLVTSPQRSNHLHFFF